MSDIISMYIKSYKWFRPSAYTSITSTSKISSSYTVLSYTQEQLTIFIMSVTLQAQYIII